MTIANLGAAVAGLYWYDTRSLGGDGCVIEDRLDGLQGIAPPGQRKDARLMVGNQLFGASQRHGISRRKALAKIKLNLGQPVMDHRVTRVSLPQTRFENVYVPGSPTSTRPNSFVQRPLCFHNQYARIFNREREREPSHHDQRQPHHSIYTSHSSGTLVTPIISTSRFDDCQQLFALIKRFN